MTLNKQGKIVLSLSELIAFILTVIGLVIAFFAWQDTKQDNQLDELAVYIQMTDEQRIEYLINSNLIKGIE